jgi:hypothetical protein
MTGPPQLDGDTRAEAIVALLGERGAAQQSHAAGRSLLDHLVGTYSTLRRWGAPSAVQHAALLHSVYGTDAYHPELIAAADRAAVQAAISSWW